MRPPNFFADTYRFTPECLGRTHDCAAVFAEWVDLRCQTLLRAGASAESARLGALVSQSPRAWEKLVESSALEVLEGTRSKLVALRDAVLFGPPALNGIDFEAMESGHTSWGGSAAAMPLWWAHSQSGCSIAEVIWLCNQTKSKKSWWSSLVMAPVEKRLDFYWSLSHRLQPW